MKHIKRIFLAFFIIGICSLAAISNAKAQAWRPDDNNNSQMRLTRDRPQNMLYQNWEDNLNINFAPQTDSRNNTRQEAGGNIYTTTKETIQPDNFVELPKEVTTYTINDQTVDKDTFDKNLKKDQTVTPPNNKKASMQDVTGCSTDYGLFSGLIDAGRKIFNGLRELIYVVAGFGIIGVAVGGFFGNLNYKWLGAIVISLVIIASTGELIYSITGCETFTTKAITDTLK